MKKTRKMLSLVITVCMVFVLVSCGGNGDKDAETTEGKETEESTGAEEEDAKETDDGENGEDVDVDFGKGVEWPEESMGDLPKPDVRVTAIIKDESSGQCVVTFSEMSEKTAAEYIQQLKDLGFGNGMEMAGEDSVIFSGTKVDGSVTFAYYTENGGGTISYGAIETEEVVDDTKDAAPWPAELMGGAPELAGRITDITNDNDRYITVYLERVEKADFEAYLEALEAAGFSVDKDKTSSLDDMDYRAYNEAGDWIRAHLRIEGSGNKATVEFEKADE